MRPMLTTIAIMAMVRMHIFGMSLTLRGEFRPLTFGSSFRRLQIIFGTPP